MQPPTVRDVIKSLEREGWRKIRQEGSHRAYKKGGKTLIVSGNLNDHLKRGTYAAIKRQAGWE